jgi:hypothetical protein
MQFGYSQKITSGDFCPKGGCYVIRCKLLPAGRLQIENEVPAPWSEKDLQFGRSNLWPEVAKKA